MEFQHNTICRYCTLFCDLRVAVEDGRVTRVVGAKDNPVYFGYSCKKGRTLPEQHYGPTRLLHSVKLQSDGTHARIDPERMMDEVAAKLTQVLRDHGPRAIALYNGAMTMMQNYAGGFLADSFFRAIGSPMSFNPGSIDQPGKPLASAMHGRWAGGAVEFDECDSLLVVGANPTVSKVGGIPGYNPEKRLRDAKERGLKLIVIDPRRSDTAEQADLHIQPVPGEDHAILAGIIRVILAERLYDHAFVDAETEGLHALRHAVEPFTPANVALRAKIPAEHILEAARLYAQNRRGRAYAGTGPNMSGCGTLTEYLVLCLDTLVGGWRKAGERVSNPGVLLPPREWQAGAEPRPERAWDYGTKLRVRGLGESASGLPTAALADEILLEGEGQVRVLFNLGGNPLGAWPDQNLVYAAMKKLELLVSCDVKMSLTAQVSHYVVPAKLTFEVPHTTMFTEVLGTYGTTVYPIPYAQYAPAIVPPPAGSELLEEWEFIYGLAQRMGLQLDILGRPVDMVNKPTTDTLIELASVGSRIPLSEVKAKSGGAVFESEPVFVQPREADWPHRLDIGNDEMMAELAELALEPFPEAYGIGSEGDFPFRMINRRMRDSFNSCSQDSEILRKSLAYNPAYMNPEDMALLGVANGDIVSLASAVASVRAVVEPDSTLRRGVVSITHGWGSLPDDPNEDPRIHGANTSRLVDARRAFDKRSGIPLMSGVPIRVTAESGDKDDAGRDAVYSDNPV
jgi:anaerobic selenocysteine-containing dehydrogenase